MGFVEMIPGRLYIGGRISTDDWGFVQRNISVIVNLRTKPDRPPFDFSRRIMIWVPITIWVTPSLELVDNLIEQLNQLFEGLSNINSRYFRKTTIGFYHYSILYAKI
ncbi:hypothetical protein [Peribacillus butanolivorans]|uniref:hypothetical protein n=1 Tax=Peribacillus butanolivorans TaxID=421767 RepID=UPI0013C347E1|nr:hypothetical protein [Peribacillus butanolivorans]